jgi:hypothetical protein
MSKPFRLSNCQVKKLMYIIRQYQLPLQKYMAMMDLQVATWFPLTPGL